MQTMKTLINWIIRWSLQVKMIFQFDGAELGGTTSNKRKKNLYKSREWTERWDETEWSLSFTLETYAIAVTHQIECSKF